MDRNENPNQINDPAYQRALEKHGKMFKRLADPTKESGQPKKLPIFERVPCRAKFTPEGMVADPEGPWRVQLDFVHLESEIDRLAVALKDMRELHDARCAELRAYGKSIDALKIDLAKAEAALKEAQRERDGLRVIVGQACSEIEETYKNAFGSETAIAKLSWETSTAREQAERFKYDAITLSAPAPSAQAPTI